VEKFSLSHPDLAIGIIPDQRIDLPADAGARDTLAIASLLSPEQIVAQGLRERVENAQRTTSEAIASAAKTLQEFGISRRQLQKTVDANIKRTAEKLGREEPKVRQAAS
jgi:hypothetical protein